MKKNKKKYDDDDGRVLYDMNVSGFKWYDKNLPPVDAAPDPEALKQERVKFKRKERRALVIAGLKAYMPRVLTLVLGFAAAGILIYLWLRSGF